MNPGGFYLAGEMGPELVQVGSTSRINNARDTAGLFSGGGGTVMHIDARGTDPALTHANFQRALAATHAQAVGDATRATQERARRTPR